MSLSLRVRFANRVGWVAVAWTIAACAVGGSDPVSSSRSPGDVIGKTWHWEFLSTPVERIDVPNPERYELELMPDGKVRARFDCNRGGGTYRIGEGELSFGPLVSTRMGCPPGSLGDRFGQELGQVTRFFIEGGKLHLELPADGGTLRFRAARSPTSGQ